MFHNQLLKNRLAGLRATLMATYEAGRGMSSASVGREREIFVKGFLEVLFPTTFRFGSGDITDRHGSSSGQCDVVIEYPFIPSFALPGIPNERLYLAEGVAAVVEVKSDIRGDKWRDISDKATALAKLERKYDGGYTGIGFEPAVEVPFFVVGFKGWSDVKDLEERIADTPVHGVLDLEHQYFRGFVPQVEDAVIPCRPLAQRKAVLPGDEELALHQFIVALNATVSSMSSAWVNLTAYSHDKAVDSQNG